MDVCRDVLYIYIYIYMCVCVSYNIYELYVHTFMLLTYFQRFEGPYAQVAEALKLNDERRQKWSGWYQEVESWKRPGPSGPG